MEQEKRYSDKVNDFLAGLPDGAYTVVIDRVELDLSVRLSPCLTLHMMVKIGPAAGTWVFKRVWLVKKRTATMLYFSLIDFCELPRRWGWTAETLTQALAGKTMNVKFITMPSYRKAGDYRRIDFPVHIDEDREKILKNIFREFK